MVKRRNGTSDSTSEKKAQNPTLEADLRDLYGVLGVSKTASQVAIKKAYHRMALQLHPDKNHDDEKAKEKFQTLQHVFGVLGDPAKRKIYDETGSIEDAELSGEKFANLYEYYRNIYTKVSPAAIDKFATAYRGSEEEKKNLLENYVRLQGSMSKVFEYVLCSEPALDSHRFMEAIEEAIAAGQVKEYKKYRKWASAVAKTPVPPDPLARRNDAEPAGVDDLQALIQGRQQERSDSLFASLEARYGGKSKRVNGGTKGKEEPSEEEFAAAQARLKAKKRQKP